MKSEHLLILFRTHVVLRGYFNRVFPESGNQIHTDMGPQNIQTDAALCLCVHVETLRPYS